MDKEDTMKFVKKMMDMYPKNIIFGEQSKDFIKKGYKLKGRPVHPGIPCSEVEWVCVIDNIKDIRDDWEYEVIE